MSHTSLEQRLRSHYSDLDRLAVIGDGEFDRSECMTAHGITFAPSRSEDGGLDFSGPTEDATQIAVDECQAALVQAGLAQP